MKEEAYLLDYPLCCVQAHYQRSALMKRTYYVMLERTAGGDIEKMQRLMRENVKLATATPQEESMLTEAQEFQPAFFTSLNMCAECAADPARPAMQQSRRYEHLATVIDDTLRQETAATCRFAQSNGASKHRPLMGRIGID